MEKNDTSTRMKSKNVVKQESDDNLSAGPPGEGMEVVSLSNKNYFTPSIMDVWPQILENVKDPRDVFSLINTAPVFRSLLENRKDTTLFSLVLPVLMKKKQLEPRDILNCRLISKAVKVDVDDALVEQQPDWVPHNTYLLAYDHGNRIQRLLDCSPDFTGSPFILRNAWFSLEKSVGYSLHYVNILQILQRFGNQLYIAALTVNFCKSPRTAMHVLKQALGYLPNVKTLDLIFEGHRDQDAIKWNNFRTCHRQFPILKSLDVLGVDCSDDYEDDTLLPASTFVRPVLLAYRKQITRLSCESFVFRGVDWKSFRFRQLRHLTVYFKTKENTEWMSETCKNVAELDCPQLESLTLFMIRGRFILTREMFQALNNFRNSLKELDLGDIDEESLQLRQVDPANIREFPQMTILRLNAANVGTGLMHLFRVMFTKLKELHFERQPWGYPSVEQSLEKIRNDYFIIFPNLKRIVWNSGSRTTKSFQIEVVLTRGMKF